MTTHTRRILDGAVDELKRNGYMCLLMLFDQKEYGPEEFNKERLEILCSETNDPKLLAAMAKDALKELSRPKENPDRSQEN